MKKVIIAVDISSLNSKDHKHHRKDGWFSIYYYKNSRKRDAKIGKECSSFKSFRDDTFYKCQSLSQKDKLFDYYKIRKPTIDKRLKNFAKKKGQGRDSHKIDYKGPYIVKQGEFVLHF